MLHLCNGWNWFSVDFFLLMIAQPVLCQCRPAGPCFALPGHFTDCFLSQCCKHTASLASLPAVADAVAVYTALIWVSLSVWCFCDTCVCTVVTAGVWYDGGQSGELLLLSLSVWCFCDTCVCAVVTAGVWCDGGQSGELLLLRQRCCRCLWDSGLDRSLHWFACSKVCA